jgi:hypothetical protein
MMINGHSINPGANLSGACLIYVDLRGADLRGANLRGADLSGANLSEANLSEANLSEANLRRANLRGADLIKVNLSGADLIKVNLSGADLRGADLRGANLSEADLSMADLSGANLHEANLHEANLRRADLSRSRGLPSASYFMRQFIKTRDGWIVYRAKGLSHYSQPWASEIGAILEETPNPDRATECGCGVSFATIQWVAKEWPHLLEAWVCLLRFEDAADICVPFGTDGKARCSRLEIVDTVRVR